jgi:hypothetical protein
MEKNVRGFGAFVPFGFENSLDIVGRKQMYSNEPEGMSTAFKPRVS